MSSSSSAAWLVAASRCTTLTSLLLDLVGLGLARDLALVLVPEYCSIAHIYAYDDIYNIYSSISVALRSWFCDRYLVCGSFFVQLLYQHDSSTSATRAASYCSRARNQCMQCPVLGKRSVLTTRPLACHAALFPCSHCSIASFRVVRSTALFNHA